LSPSINSARVPELSVAIAIASVLLAIQWICHSRAPFGGPRWRLEAASLM